MSETRSTIERVVIATVAARCVDRPIDVSVETEVLSVLDSMGMMSALVEFQDALQLELEPEAIIRIFKCRRIGEIVEVLEECSLATQAADA